jgi:hypothetical protein
MLVKGQCLCGPCTGSSQTGSARYSLTYCKGHFSAALAPISGRKERLPAMGECFDKGAIITAGRMSATFA